MHPSVLPSMQDVVQTALGFQGVRYQLGGDAPDTGFDCSGFVRYVFASNHIDLPRTVVEQFGAGVSIRVSDLRPGDLLFFSTIAPGPSHVAIATGGHDFVHAPGSNGAVRVDGLSTPYWRDRLIGARRVL